MATGGDRREKHEQNFTRNYLYSTCILDDDPSTAKHSNYQVYTRPPNQVFHETPKRRRLAPKDAPEVSASALNELTLMLQLKTMSAGTHQMPCT